MVVVPIGPVAQHLEIENPWRSWEAKEAEVYSIPASMLDTLFWITIAEKVQFQELSLETSTQEILALSNILLLNPEKAAHFLKSTSLDLPQQPYRKW